MTTWFPRALGGLTLLYSAASIANPKVMASPCGLTDALGEVSRETARTIRAVAVRDAVISAGMLVVPAGAPLTQATTLRGLCDLSDVVTLGLPAAPERRAKILAVAGAWGTLVLLSRRWAR